MLVIGVNGCWKDDIRWKACRKSKDQGKSCPAARQIHSVPRPEPSFRSGLQPRLGGDDRRGQEGADPGAIVYDAVAATKSAEMQIVLLCDTAGRLHNKKNLMENFARLTVFWKRISGCIP